MNIESLLRYRGYLYRAVGSKHLFKHRRHWKAIRTAGARGEQPMSTLTGIMNQSARDRKATE